jgi:hypothetical protein
MRRGVFGSGLVMLTILAATSVAGRADDHHALTIATVASTVPANGDVNPYGVARVRESKGGLHEGHILVSNFNNGTNTQGTGTTIVDISPKGTVSLFAHIDPNSPVGQQCPGGVGLTTALVALRSGWVIVGSLPTNANAQVQQSGCLFVLDSSGNTVEAITDPAINGPWDMTALDTFDGALLFVTNVLNGLNGTPAAANQTVVNLATVIRIPLQTFGKTMPQVGGPITVIGSGFPARTDPAALVIGPTGVGLSDDGVLYVADTLGNRIAAIRNAIFRQSSANTGRTVTSNGSLNGPLGLAIGPKDVIATVNSGDGNLVFTRPGGKQILTTQLDATPNPSPTPAGAGALFGLAFAPEGLYFVDDVANTLNLLRLPEDEGEQF